MFGQYTGTVTLDVWTPTNGWQYNIWSQSGATQTSSGAAWDSVNVPLTNLANDTIRIRFRAFAPLTLTGDMALDDVYFQNGPTCPQPTGFSRDEYQLHVWFTGYHDRRRHKLAIGLWHPCSDPRGDVKIGGPLYDAHLVWTDDWNGLRDLRAEHLWGGGHLGLVWTFAGEYPVYTGFCPMVRGL